MHELALAQGIVDIVSDAARAERFSRVTRIGVTVGALSHVEPDALSFGFDAVSRGTIAEGAELRIERPPGTAFCFGCSEEVKLSRRGDGCPACGSFQVMVTGGDELRVTELEVE